MLISTAVWKRTADLLCLLLSSQCSLCGPQAFLVYILLQREELFWASTPVWNECSTENSASPGALTGNLPAQRPGQANHFSLSYRCFNFHLFQSKGFFPVKKSSMTRLSLSKNSSVSGCKYKLQQWGWMSMAVTSPTECSPQNWIISASVFLTRFLGGIQMLQFLQFLTP